MNKISLNIQLMIFIIFILKIDTNTIFPGPKSSQEQACINQKSPSVEKCRAVEKAHNQDACCYITYTNENGQNVMKCGYLENTEFGIKVYKNIYYAYKDIKIQCNSNYIRNYILIIYDFFN